MLVGSSSAGLESARKHGPIHFIMENFERARQRESEILDIPNDVGPGGQVAVENCDPVSC